MRKFERVETDSENWNSERVWDSWDIVREKNLVRNKDNIIVSIKQDGCR